MTADGVFTEYQLPVTRGLKYIAACADGNLWFTEGIACNAGSCAAWLGGITTDGAIKECALPSGMLPEAIIQGPDGDVWFTEGYSIGRVFLP